MQLSLNLINTKRNLLAFSAGVDSSALFFILLENNIPFDLAIVDYNYRKQSKEEIAYAKELALKYNKKLYIKDSSFENLSNFEKKARDIRYKFFDEIISEYSYESLITAHQLNDKLEWFLMQFTKGAGLNELLSFEEISKRKNYTVFKPLVNISKETLINYLNKNKIKYFIDESNNNEDFKRNYFRKNFSDRLLKEFETGIKNSLIYLNKDLKSLEKKEVLLYNKEELEIFKNSKDENLNIRMIDKSLKKRGLLLSKKQREEIIKEKELVVSHKIAISIEKEFIYICPYLTNLTLTKEFKELCRINKIPKKCRAYIYRFELLDSILKKIK